MQNLTILVDMDDVLENLCETWVAQLNGLYQLSVSMDDIREWDMRKAFPTLSPQEIYWPLKTNALWENVKPLPGAVEYLKRLIDDGHRVVVVTASGAEAVPIKLQKVLFKYFPYLTMKDVVVAEQKGLIIGDVMIDDAPHNLRDFTGKKILFNQPHNRSFNAADSEMQRVDGWGEIYEIIKQGGEKD